MRDLAAARSFLFVPATRPERIEKAKASGADAVIVDLEDAVAPQEKAAARETLQAALVEDAGILLRINAAGTKWHDEDLALLAHPGISGVVLAKAERAEDIEKLGKPVVALIETARGLANARPIAAARGTRRLAFGTIDFMADLGLPEDGAAMAIYRAELALASRLAGIGPPIDGVTTAIDDDALIAEETRRALAFGFGARLAIHPRQIGPIHDALRPTDAEIARARRIVEAAETSDGGAIRLDGAMVDAPVVLQARAVLARA
ncbi:HpcH/HpaI aldolase/citrate lyase family protein [Jiella mangrovi]|uniref:CoA ester lyase n=1 Tax=Jiella mangrovi TaxID=2821407 RepID=A0ABS4BK19_9HYPH|nr:CoA ester lyase [Jiella mangrovi]MBP0616897.1 CoA ester lyase [Jiella mangrovi]